MEPHLPPPPPRPPWSDIPPPPSPYAPPPAVAPRGSSESAGMATAALVCGIVGVVLFIFLVPSVVALVLGLIAAGRARRHPHPGDGRGRAIAGWILGIVGVVAFVAVVIAAIVAEEQDGSSFFEDDEVSVRALEAGDCVNLPRDDDALIEELPRRDCDAPHDAEVYLVDDLESDEDDDYPESAVVSTLVDGICRGEAFRQYVGVNLGGSRYGYHYFYPSEESWQEGNREYVCMVVPRDGRRLSGSVEGTGD